MKVSEVLPAIPLPLDGDSLRLDARNLIDEAAKRGYAIADDVTSLRDAPAASTKLLGIFSTSHLPYVLDRRYMKWDRIPSLAAMTDAALTILDRHDKGFFLMVEGGRIDHAGEDNDAGTMLHETLEFDEAVEACMSYQAENPETLLIAATDHGTGGFSFSYMLRTDPREVPLPSGETYRRRYTYPGKHYLELVGKQSASYLQILAEADGDPDALIEATERVTGFVLSPDEAARVLVRNSEGHAETDDFKEFYLDPETSAPSLLGRALARQSFIVWSTGGHTTELVPVFGSGPGAEALRGVYPNYRLYTVMKEALGGR